MTMSDQMVNRDGHAVVMETCENILSILKGGR